MLTNKKKPEKKKGWRTRRGQVDIPRFFSISKRNKKGPSPWTKTVVFNMYQLPNRASTPPPPSPSLTLGCTLSVILPGQEWVIQRISGLLDPEDLGLVFESTCHPIRIVGWSSSGRMTLYFNHPIMANGQTHTLNYQRSHLPAVEGNCT